MMVVVVYGVNLVFVNDDDYAMVIMYGVGITHSIMLMILELHGVTLYFIV